MHTFSADLLPYVREVLSRANVAWELKRVGEAKCNFMNWQTAQSSSPSAPGWNMAGTWFSFSTMPVLPLPSFNSARDTSPTICLRFVCATTRSFSCFQGSWPLGVSPRLEHGRNMVCPTPPWACSTFTAPQLNPGHLTPDLPTNFVVWLQKSKKYALMTANSRQNWHNYDAWGSNLWSRLHCIRVSQYVTTCY